MSTEYKLTVEAKENLFANKSIEEREKLLPEMVEYALNYGIKPAARYYNTYPKLVRRWVNIYKELGKEGLKYKRKK